MEISKLSIKTGLKLVVWGIPIGLLLRLVQLNFFFDFDTGFYTDGGATAWLSLLLPAAMALVGGLLFWRNSGAFTARERGAARGPGIFAGLSGGVLLVQGAYMIKDWLELGRMGPAAFETTGNTGLHLALAAMCLIFGALQCLNAGWLCMGLDVYKRAPLLYLPGVAWGMAELVAVYVYYARSSSTVENLFSMAGTALLLTALFYLCGALSGWNEPRAIKRLCIFGGLSSALLIPYDLGSIALALGGNTYFGEFPPLYALGRLMVSIFLLSFMLSSYRTAVDKSKDGAPAAPKHSED